MEELTHFGVKGMRWGVRKSESGSSKKPSNSGLKGFDSPSERAVRNPDAKTPGKARKAILGDQTPEGVKKQQLKAYGVTIDPERDGSHRKRAARNFFTGSPINKKGLTPDQRKVYKKAIRKTRLKALGTGAAVVAAGYGLDYVTRKAEDKRLKVSDMKRKNARDKANVEARLEYSRKLDERKRRLKEQEEHREKVRNSPVTYNRFSTYYV
jgi:hypothetical protein